MTVLWLDGRIRDEEGAVLPLRDRGLLLGDGLFETVRLYEGGLFRLGAHLRRLEEGLVRIGFGAGAAGGALARVREGIAAVREDGRLETGALRVTVTRGAGPGGVDPPEPAAPSVAVSLRPYAPDPEWYERGISVALTGGRVNEGALSAGLKHLGYLEFILARREARRKGAEDGLLLNGRGDVAEGTASNVFLVQDGTLRTPDPSQGILPGVTRATVLELAESSGISVREGRIGAGELEEADEIFLTSSLRELVPVAELDAGPVGAGKPGPVYRALHARYRRAVQEEAGSAR